MPSKKIQIIVIGRNTFHPNLIIWSYLYLGNVALNHKKRKIKNIQDTAEKGMITLVVILGEEFQQILIEKLFMFLLVMLADFMKAQLDLVIINMQIL